MTSIDNNSVPNINNNNNNYVPPLYTIPLNDVPIPKRAPTVVVHLDNAHRSNTNFDGGSRLESGVTSDCGVLDQCGILCEHCSMFGRFCKYLRNFWMYFVGLIILIGIGLFCFYKFGHYVHHTQEVTENTWTRIAPDFNEHFGISNGGKETVSVDIEQNIRHPSLNTIIRFKRGSKNHSTNCGQQKQLLFLKKINKKLTPMAKQVKEMHKHLGLNNGTSCEDDDLDSTEIDFLDTNELPTSNSTNQNFIPNSSTQPSELSKNEISKSNVPSRNIESNEINPKISTSSRPEVSEKSTLDLSESMENDEKSDIISTSTMFSKNSESNGNNPDVSTTNRLIPELFTNSSKETSESMESSEKTISTSTLSTLSIESNEISPEVSDESKEKLPNTNFFPETSTAIENSADNIIGSTKTIKFEIHTKISTSKIVSKDSEIISTTPEIATLIPTENNKDRSSTTFSEISLSTTPEMDSLIPTEKDNNIPTNSKIEFHSKKGSQNNGNFNITLEMDSLIPTENGIKIATSSNAEVSSKKEKQNNDNFNTTPEMDSFIPTENDINISTNSKIEVSSKIAFQNNDIFHTTSEMDSLIPTENDIKIPTNMKIEFNSKKGSQNNGNLITTTEMDSLIPTENDIKISTSSKIEVSSKKETQNNDNFKTVPEMDSLISTENIVGISTTSKIDTMPEIPIEKGTSTVTTIDSNSNNQNSVISSTTPELFSENFENPTTINEILQNISSATNNFISTTETSVSEFSTKTEIQNLNNNFVNTKSEMKAILEKDHDVLSRLSTKIMEPSQTINSINVPKISTENSILNTLTGRISKNEIGVAKNPPEITQTPTLSTENILVKTLGSSTESIQKTAKNVKVLKSTTQMTTPIQSKTFPDDASTTDNIERVTSERNENTSSNNLQVNLLKSTRESEDNEIVSMYNPSSFKNADNLSPRQQFATSESVKSNQELKLNMPNGGAVSGGVICFPNPQQLPGSIAFPQQDPSQSQLDFSPRLVPPGISTSSYNPYTNYNYYPMTYPNMYPNYGYYGGTTNPAKDSTFTSLMPPPICHFVNYPPMYASPNFFRKSGSRSRIAHLDDDIVGNPKNELINNNVVLECSSEKEIACRDGSKCILNTQQCDGNIDCRDLSDELSCSCKQRVDKSRLCDGFFDCPNGEDELGCFGCDQNEFSCDDWNRHQDQVTCVALEQRCDGIQQCIRNGKDEMDCSLLTESIFQHQAYHVSLSRGILHRNYRGVWYPVCNNDDKWANEVCLHEVGAFLAPPTLKKVSFSRYTGKFIESILPSGDASLIENCPSLTYVECPKMECGTRLGTANFRNEGEDNDILQLSEEDQLFRIKRQDNERVVGGLASKPAAWPWVIALYRDGIFHCGGVIINEIWVMTAAHCVDKFWQHYFEVQAGMLRRFSFSPMEQIRSVKYVIVHQSYDRSSMKNDLSLLRLGTPLVFNRWIRNICLPNMETAGQNWLWGPPPGTICTAVGWGATFEHGPDPDHMRDVEIPILPSCKHRLDREGAEICAGFAEGGRDACQGDSGGPLLCLNPINKNQWYVAGVVSHGEGCARPEEPGVYTRVALFIKWIQLNLLETSFPQRKPLSHCPGISCITNGENNSGKCLSRRRRCDYVVDCLTSEDELNCEDRKELSKISRQTWESLLTAKYSRKSNENLLKSISSTFDPNETNSTALDLTQDYVDDSFLVGQVENVSTTTQLSELPSASPVVVSTNNPLQDSSTISKETETNFVASTLKPETISTILPTTISAMSENGDNFMLPVPINSIQKSYFQCKKILQNIPIDKRCDKQIDCEDATDEKDCSCKSFLEKSHPEAICDGNFDCADGSDEFNCFSCLDDYFFCEKSLQCVKMILRCDGKSDCQFNEDEKDCVLLTNAKTLYIQIDGKPKLEKAGYVTTLINSTWQPYCNHNLDHKNATDLAIDVCNNLGHPSFYDRFLRDIRYSQIELRYSNGTKVSNNFGYQTEKNCKALFVRCHIEIFTKLSEFYLGTNNYMINSYEENNEYFWPWNGIIYVNGIPKCTGTLINVNWVLTSQFCGEEMALDKNYIVAAFGIGKGYLDIENPYEQIRRINYISNVANISLMHLETPTNYSRFVKPLPINAKVTESLPKDICVTVGIDKQFNMLKSIFLKPISQNCPTNQRCFKQIQKPNDCSNYTYPWSGTVVCFSQISGWYPSAVYHELNGPCSFTFSKSLTSIISSLNLIVQNLRTKLIISKPPSCTGLRCPLGECIEANRICDSTTNCRDGCDETLGNCESRHLLCRNQTCDCTPDEFKCKNGQCVHKSKFCDGILDCLDRSDETETCSCSDYLNSTSQHLICDGIRNCLDKSDEKLCNKCTPKSFKCDDSKCILQEFVCDGERDCSNGEDEKHCLALKHNKEHDRLASGEVYIRSSGLWHVKCFPKPNITQIEIETICNQIRFMNGRRIPLEISATSSDGEHVIREPVFEKFQAIRLNRIKILYARLGSNIRPFASLKYVKKQCNIVHVICE